MSYTEREIIERLQQLTGEEFEHFIADLWSERGWETSITPYSGDRGVDVIAERTEPFDERMVIQTKRYQPGNPVGGRNIREYSATRNQLDNVDKVVVITTSGFTESAKEEANDQNVKLINGKKLAELISKGNSNILAQYTSQPGSGEIVSEDLIEKSTPRSSKKKVEDRPSDYSERLRVDLTGLRWVDTEIQKEGRFLTPRKSKKFSGYIATFDLFGKDSEFGPEIEEREEVQFHTKSGETFSPGVLSGKLIPEGWKTHTGQWDTVYVPAGEMVKYVVPVAAPPGVDFHMVTMQRWDIEIELTEKLEPYLMNLPDDIESIL